MPFGRCLRSTGSPFQVEAPLVMLVFMVKHCCYTDDISVKVMIFGIQKIF